MAQVKKEENSLYGQPKPYQHHKKCAKTSACYIPIEVLEQSQQGYNVNRFTLYLNNLFGADITDDLIKHYHIGTSGSRWPGATVFWWMDITGKVRAGQVKQFDITGHTVKSATGKSHTTWIHSILQYTHEQKQENLPAWLTDYLQQGGNYVSCLFGEHLLKENTVKPVALVEAPATAIVASVYMPEFIWLATGSLSYLSVERATALKGRKVVLFPDLSQNGNAYAKWEHVAKKLSDFMFIQVSDLLEKNATEEERRQGLDLRDFLTRYRFSSFNTGAENFLKISINNKIFHVKSLITVSCPGSYTKGLQIPTFELEKGGYCDVIVDEQGEFYTGELTDSIKEMWGNGFKIGRVGATNALLRVYEA
ncbi:DUF6371 domain-containing protein [Chitinophaga dinghuensis]|nr:DUF6371 domain-containing protein [Chitinophaga dinghuensis]